MSLVLLLNSCGERSEEEPDIAPPYPRIEASELLVIHHGQDGSLVDYLALKGISKEMAITVKPLEGRTEIYVTVLGTKRDSLLKRDFTVFSQFAEGEPGQIDVFIEKGKAVSINGNGMKSPSLVSAETLQLIEERLSAGQSSADGPSTIKIGEEKVE